MISETAFFVKDVIGPKGCVSIVPEEGAPKQKSDSVEGHSATQNLLFHSAELNEDGSFKNEDERIRFDKEYDHQELCEFEQSFFLKSIQEDLDLSDHIQNAITSLQIALACDESVHTGKVVYL